MPIEDLCRKHGFSEASYHLWRSKRGGMIYLKLRPAGHAVNYKRVERLYQEASLQVWRRKRQKVPPKGNS
jgi:hypothetical protein